MAEFTLKGWNVLVVDDEPDILLLLGYILDLYDANVTCASSGQEALERMQNQVFHLGLFDILMSKVTGWDLLRAVRESGNINTRTMPLVAVTAMAMPGDRERLLEAGFDAYMAKPIDAEVFAATIRGLVLEERDEIDASAGSRKARDMGDDTLAMADQLRRILQQTQESLSAEPATFELEYDISERMSSEVSSLTTEKESADYGEKLPEPAVVHRGLRGFFHRHRHHS
jgi:CheY-like chemotaxis protein